MRFGDLFAWLQYRLPPNTLKYYDNNFYSSLLDLLFIITLATVLYVPTLIMRMGSYLFCCRSCNPSFTPSRSRRPFRHYLHRLFFCSWFMCEYVLAAIIAILLGMLFIVPIMFGKLSLYVGIPCLVLWWTLCIIHTSRIRDEGRRKKYSNSGASTAGSGVGSSGSSSVDALSSRYYYQDVDYDYDDERDATNDETYIHEQVRYIISVNNMLFCCFCFLF